MIRLLFYFLSRWPLWALHAFGSALGWVIYTLSPSYRRKMFAHASVAYPDPAQCKRVVHSSVGQAGKAILELPFLWGRTTAEGAASCTDYIGWEVIEVAQRTGKGIIFLTPHLGSFESTAQVFSARAPITVLYRPNRNAQLQQIIEASRKRENVAIAPTTLAGVKVLLKALRRGEAVGMLPDQVPNYQEGVWAPMFGKMAYTMTLPASLFHATGATIILALGIRKPWGRGFTLILEKGPESLSKEPHLAAAEINRAMESLIMRYPSQYYWGYERYKAPKGQPDNHNQTETVL